MPPASLSTLAVMKPGPTTARTRAIRTRHSLSQVITPHSRASEPTACDPLWPFDHRHGPRQRSGPAHAGAVSPLMAVPEHRDHVVGGDDAGEASMFVDDGEGDEVVLVEECGNLGLRRVACAGHVRLAQVRQ